ncbi:MAG: GNAT family N-acetyltransferase [Candidatus Dormiibacterota bacterium]
MPSAPALETPRLLLRHWRDDDRPAFAALNADPAVMEHFPATMAPAESDALAARAEAALDSGPYGLWALEDRGTGRFLGFTGLSVPSFAAPFMPAVEIGWRLRRDAWGQGFAQESARAARDYGFAEAGLDGLVSFTAMSNVRSQRVMQRIGMTHGAEDDFEHPRLPEGHRLRHHVLYRLSRDQWTALGH